MAVPYQGRDVASEQAMEIGYIQRKNSILSPAGEQYISEIKKYLGIAEK